MQSKHFPAIAPGAFEALLVDDDSVWLGSSDGLFHFSLSENIVTPITLPESISSTQIKSIVQDDAGNIWAAVYGTDTSETFLSGGLIKIENLQVTKAFFDDKDIAITQLIPFESNIYVVSSNLGILVFDTLAKEVTGNALNTNQAFPVVMGATMDHVGCFWLATLAGIVSSCHGETVHYPQDSEFLQAQPGADFYSAYFDTRSNIVWLGGYYGGAIGINRNNAESLRFSLHNSGEGALSSNNVYTLSTANNGDLWIGYNGEGVDVIDYKTLQVTNQRIGPSGSRANHVLTIFHDNNDDIYLGTFGAGVWKKAADETVFSPFIQDENPSLQKSVITRIIKNDGDIWVASIRELLQLDTNGNVRRRLPQAELLNQSLLYGMKPIDKHRLGLLSSSGLILLNKDSFEQTHITTLAPDATQCHGTLLDAVIGSNGLLWFLDKSLCGFDPVKNEIVTISSSEHYTAGANAILQLDEHIFATSTGKVLISHLQDNQVRSVDKSVGHFLDSTVPHFGAIARFKQYLVSGNSKGLTWLDLTQAEPGKLPVNELFPTQLVIMNQPSTPEKLSNQHPLRIHYNDKVVIANFEMVDHFKRDLSFSASMPSLLDEPLPLTSLAGFAMPTGREGYHTITINAHYADSLLDSYSFDIKVLPPWWRHSFAYIAYLLLLILLALSYTRFRQKQLRQETLRLNKTVEEQTKQLHQVLKQKETLFENISHELRTPLTVIMGKVEKLLARAPNDDLLAVERQSNRLYQLVEKLLKLAEIRAVELTDVAVNLHTSLNNGVAALKPLADEKHIQLQVSSDCDKQSYYQLKEDTIPLLMANLLGNAIKFSPEHSTIRIEQYFTDNHELIICVSDQGPGFDDPAQALERFRHGKDGKQGSGLGLAIVNEIAVANGGELSIENLASGGAKLCVRLKTCLAEAPQPAVNGTNALQTDAKPGLATKPRLLIAEDEPSLRSHLVDLLEGDFEVEMVTNGAEALATLDQGKLPDLVLSDVMMPEISGFELCQQIKNTEEYTHIPVVLLTAKADLDSQKQGLAEFADDYITKPFSSNVLLLKLINIYRTRQAYKKQLLDSVISLKPVADTASPASTVTQKIQTLLAENYANEKFTGQHMASELAISEKTLNRRLQAIFGQSFSSVLRDYRLERAYEMLQQSNIVQNVAFDVGFSSPAYFTKCFKQRFGIKPSELSESSATGE